MDLKNMFKSFFSKFDLRFNKLEKSIIKSLLLSLSENNRKILESQLSKINNVKRDPEGYESYFYWIKHGKSNRNFPIRFEVQEGEYKLADMSVSYFGRQVPISVWLYDGVIFRIEYGPSVTTLEPRDNYQIEEINIYIK